MLIVLFTAIRIGKPRFHCFRLKARLGKALGSFLKFHGSFDVVGRPLEKTGGDSLLAFFKMLFSDRVVHSDSLSLNHYFNELRVYN